jgi:hypothetical protein
MRVRCPDVRSGCEKVQRESGAELRLLSCFWAGTEVELAVLGKIAYERQTGNALNSWLKSQLVITGQRAY